MSKLIESVLVVLFGDSLQSSDLQFGFKRNSSYCHAIFTFNESVRYFIKMAVMSTVLPWMPPKLSIKFFLHNELFY